jgi:hypothetical protein
MKLESISDWRIGAEGATRTVVSARAEASDTGKAAQVREAVVRHVVDARFSIALVAHAHAHLRNPGREKSLRQSSGKVPVKLFLRSEYLSVQPCSRFDSNITTLALYCDLDCDDESRGSVS